MLTVAFGLGSSVCWGFADFMAGMQSRRLPVASVMLVSQTTGLALIALAVTVGADSGPPGREALIAAGAGAGAMVALAAFYRALAIGTMSIVAPVASTGAAIPVVVGLATGDRPSSVALAGIGVALAGVLLASRESSEQAGSAGDRRAIGLALVAAVGFGCFFVLIDEASGASILWTIFFSRIAGVVGLLGFLGVTRAAIGLARSDLPLLCFVGALDLGAVALYSAGTQEGLLSVLAVLSSLYPVVPVVMGRLVLEERLARVQAAGVACALAGVVLIAAG